MMIPRGFRRYGLVRQIKIATVVLLLLSIAAVSGATAEDLEIEQSSVFQGERIDYEIPAQEGETFWVVIEDEYVRDDPSEVFRFVDEVVNVDTISQNRREYSFAKLKADEDIAAGQIQTEHLEKTEVEVELYDSNITNTTPITRWTSDGFETIPMTIENRGTSGYERVTIKDPTPSFDVSIDSTNSPVMKGDDMVINVSITNTGAESDLQTVTSEVRNIGSDSERVRLSGESSTTERLRISTRSSDGGSYALSVNTDDDSDTTDVAVKEKPAFFNISIESTNSPVAEGDILTVDMNITNTGDQDGTQTVTAEVPEVGLDSETVNLSSGSSTTEVLRIPTDSGDDGSYTLYANTESDDDSTRVAVETKQPIEDDDGGTEENEDGRGTEENEDDDSPPINETKEEPPKEEHSSEGSGNNWPLYVFVALGLVASGYGGYKIAASSEDKNKNEVTEGKSPLESDYSESKEYNQSPKERLQELEKLYEEGVVSEEEYKEKKSEILDEL